MLRCDGNRPSSHPGRKHGWKFETFGGVQRHDADLFALVRCSLSMIRLTCSRNPCRFSNCSSALTNSLRFSSRPGASGVLSFCQIRCSRFIQMISATSMWYWPSSRHQACQRSRPSTSLASSTPPLPTSPLAASKMRAPSIRHTFGPRRDLDFLLRLITQAALGRVHDPFKRQIIIGAETRGGNRPSHRGFPNAHKSAGRR